MTTLIMATRRSALALAQSRLFVRSLEKANPSIKIEELHVVTTGDREQKVSLVEIGGKGLFIKELEEALYKEEADFAVHSMKDVPADVAPGLILAAVPKREDPRDALISNNGKCLMELAPGSRIGTSSLRRMVSIQRIRPDLRMEMMRGNVDTRLRKLREGEVDAIVLAMAGLNRLNLGHVVTEALDPSAFIPAVAQGALGIECRDGDDVVKNILRPINDPESELCVIAERIVMKMVDGSCKTPIAVYAKHVGSEIWMSAMLADPDGSRPRMLERKTSWSDSIQDVERFAQEVGAELRRL